VIDRLSVRRQVSAALPFQLLVIRMTVARPSRGLAGGTDHLQQKNLEIC
jgi:hypothetical protein